MRKAILPMIMALMVCLTTFVAAYAAPGDEPTPSEGDVLTVSVNWDDPTFTYLSSSPAERIWNPEKHAYELNGTLDGAWDKTSASVTVKNYSKGAALTVSSGLYSAEDTDTRVESYKIHPNSDIAVSIDSGEEQTLPAYIDSASSASVSCELSGNKVDEYFLSSGATTAVTGMWAVDISAVEVVEPILAPNTTWYKGAASRSYITEIELVDSYTPNGTEQSWDASAEQNGSVMAYIDGTKLILAGNGSGKIFANADSSRAFSNAKWTNHFTSLTTITGIGLLDTSRVTDMNNMFYNCKALTDLDVSAWNTSNVTDMSSMFYVCPALTNLNVTGFDTSRVTDMSWMFSGCEALTSLNLSGFDTSNVTDMSFMFNGCSKLTSLNVSNFITDSVTDMNNMFNECFKLTSLDLSSFNTAKVTNMKNMFCSCVKLTSLDISNFNTANVTDMSLMFSNCAVSSLNLTNFVTTNVANMSNMFAGCDKLANLDVTSFDTSNVIFMGNMFDGCSVLARLDVTGFNTSSVKDMWRMFAGCEALTSLDVTGFNTSNVTDMGEMFGGCSALSSLILTGFDTSQVSDMSSMFSNCRALTTIYVSELWSTTNVTSSEDMFLYCYKLKGTISYDSSKTDATYANYTTGYFTYEAAPATVSTMSLARVMPIMSVDNADEDPDSAYAWDEPAQEADAELVDDVESVVPENSEEAQEAIEVIQEDESAGAEGNTLGTAA